MSRSEATFEVDQPLLEACEEIILIDQSKVITTPLGSAPFSPRTSAADHARTGAIFRP